MPMNGIFNFGFDTNSTPSEANRISLSLESKGVQADTSEGTVTRQLRGTKQLRLPYPGQARDDVTQESGTNATARIALDDFVFRNCTNIVLTLQSGLYRAGTVSNKSATVSVANESFLAHPRSLAKWSWPPYWRITNDTYQIRCVAFHRSGANYQPVRAVKFWAICEDGSTNEPVVITNATVDASMPDAVPVVEYVATLSAANFGQSKWVTNHFAVFPWVGDADSVVRTDDGVNSAPSPYYAPYPLLCDRLGTYGAAVGVVATNGSDANGRILRASDWRSAAPPSPFRTVDGAVAALKGSNSLWFARGDAGGGTIYLREGDYAWTGGSSFRGTRPGTWLTVDGFPGDVAANVVFTNRGSSYGFASGVDRIRNVRFRTTVGGTFRNVDKLWLDGIRLESAEVSCFVSPTNVWVTHSTLITNGTVGLDYLSPISTTFHLVRGCLFSQWGGASRGIQAHTIIGNLRPDDVSGSNDTTPAFYSYTGKPPKDGKDIILAFNRFYYLASVTGTAPLNWFRGMTSSDGLAIVQNLMEVHKSSATAGQPVLAISWSSSTMPTSNRVNNVLIWHNTFVGSRCNLGEDACGNGLDGGLEHHRTLWSVRGNLFASCNTKHDTEYIPNGGRTFGWPVLYGVGWSGNLDQKLQTDCGPWRFAFFGAPGYQFPTCSDARTNWFGYVSYRGWQGGTNFGGGGGDYHLTSGSPAVGFPVLHSLPYDIEGADRRLGDASGAYSYALPLLPLLRQVNPAVGSSGFRVSTESASGRTYVLESTDGLPAAAWNPRFEIQGTGASLELIDSNPPVARRFYRILQK
jgi:hypothetical protein